MRSAAGSPPPSSTETTARPRRAVALPRREVAYGALIVDLPCGDGFRGPRGAPHGPRGISGADTDAQGMPHVARSGHIHGARGTREVAAVRSHAVAALPLIGEADLRRTRPRPWCAGEGRADDRPPSHLRDGEPEGLEHLGPHKDVAHAVRVGAQRYQDAIL